MNIRDKVAGLEPLLDAGNKSSMNSVRQLILSLLAILTASGVLAVFLGSPEFIGSQALIIRAAILDSAMLLVSLPFTRWFRCLLNGPEYTASWFACLHCSLRFCISVGCYRSAVRGEFREIS